MADIFTKLPPEQVAEIEDAMIEVLNARERRVISLSFGLFDGNPWDNRVNESEAERAKQSGTKPSTRRKLAAERLGITSARYTAIETAAIKKLRKRLKHLDL